jgi:regulator of protease activity HflC (stomatin/prohibitin superfamily)
MLWLILIIVLIIIALGGALFGGRTEVRAAVPVLALVVAVIASLFFTFHRVGQRQAGIVYNLSGTISGNHPKSPGIVTTWPWQHVKTEHVGTQRIDFVFGPDSSAVSKDQQDIYAKVSVNLNVEPNDVLHLYKTVGSQWKQIILEPRVPQDFKEITATYLTTDIPKNREEIRKQTRARLRQEMTDRGYGIDVQDVFLTNLDYSQSYKQAIEAKQRQVQETLQAQARVGQAQAEADQRAAKADGEARAIRTKARADADAIYLKGKAIRKNPEILRLEAIDKLNPLAQVVFCTNSNCPSFLPQALQAGK